MHKWARFIKNIVGQWNYFEPPANTKRKKKSYDDHLEKSCVYKILSLILILFENHFYKQINTIDMFCSSYNFIGDQNFYPIWRPVVGDTS